MDDLTDQLAGSEEMMIGWMVEGIGKQDRTLKIMKLLFIFYWRKLTKKMICSNFYSFSPTCFNIIILIQNIPPHPQPFSHKKIMNQYHLILPLFCLSDQTTRKEYNFLLSHDILEQRQLGTLKIYFGSQQNNLCCLHYQTS